MAFNIDQFRNAVFQTRTSKVSVPGLKSFFADDETPEIEIRNLTGSEILQARGDVDQNILARKAVAEIGTDDSEIAAAVRTILGGSTISAPDKQVEYLTFVTLGVVNPTLSRSDAVKMSQHNPIEFMDLAQSIMRLSGLGSVEKGKSIPSGKTTGSETP